jgi:CRISPR/Cas system endoribonuclease Cas6 (RAMP superfamily)
MEKRRFFFWIKCTTLKQIFSSFQFNLKQVESNSQLYKKIAKNLYNLPYLPKLFNSKIDFFNDSSEYSYM